MANNYAGFLIKFGNTVMPNEYLQEYITTPNRRLEASAERDQNGNLWRDTLPNQKTNIKFSTHILFLEDKIKFQNIINSGMVNSVQRKCLVTYWNDETNTYKTGYFYLPDVEYSVLDASGTDIQYSPIAVELVEY
ncbi:MAG: DUF6711 family protein [Ruminococcus sp.]|nr:DUF6711 family protein [Ruminococcus sp.]